MEIEELYNLETTLSENLSIGLWNDTLRQDWRCYHSKKYWDTHHLIERFISSHSRHPGPLTETMLSSLPVAVGFWKSSNKRSFVRSYLYSNGAIFFLFQENMLTDEYLFVDHTTAERWVYPDDWFLYRDTLSEESRNKLMAGGKRRKD